VVLVTAASDREGRARALDAGADDFLATPVDRAELLTRVRSLLRLKDLYDQVAESDDEIARQAAELAATNSELMKLTAELEERVAARTAELEAKNEEIKNMSQQLWQTAKLATMGEHAASIAHELNNPLATISLRIESMLYSVGPDDPNHRALEIVDGEVERMAKLVARLLEFSRRGEQQVTTVDIPSEIESALELVQTYLRNRRVESVTDFGAGQLMVHADRQQFRQVMLNVITNGCDAMPDGGSLTIRVQRVRSEEHSSEPDPDQNYVRTTNSIVIEISDTGTGISPEVLPHILEPFFTTKPQGRGTGLGLAICRRIVQEHNGKLEIQSEVGLGTTIRIVLPATDNGETSRAS
jgi:signal transduction histidine kinase